MLNLCKHRRNSSLPRHGYYDSGCYRMMRQEVEARKLPATKKTGWLALILASAILLPGLTNSNTVYSQSIYDLHESERSDKFTGGGITKAEFVPGEPDIRLTLNVPSFRLTFWQNGNEVKSYFVGIGLRAHPIYIGEREASEIIWNPPWIPPHSDWVRKMRGVRPGEFIKPGDPRNPLGKMKIPLGDGYLIHEAASPKDLGNLVSHGCVRMLRRDIYDLADKIVLAKNADISRRRINAAKRTSRTLVVGLEEPVPVDINYDTLVVENGILYVYPDVYARGINDPQRLRLELESSNVGVSNLDDETIRRIFAKVTRRKKFAVKTSSIEEGRVLKDGRVSPVIGNQ